MKPPPWFICNTGVTQLNSIKAWVFQLPNKVCVIVLTVKMADHYGVIIINNHCAYISDGLTKFDLYPTAVASELGH